MGTFRCLLSNETVNYNTGADLGSGTSARFYLPHTPIDYASLSGTLYDGDVAVQTFTVGSGGALALTDIGTPTPKVSAGTLSLLSGKLSLTWSSAPGANHAVVTYTGGAVYRELTYRLFKVTCPKINQLCSSRSTGYVAAVTVCNQNLYV